MAFIESYPLFIILALVLLAGVMPDLLGLSETPSFRLTRRIMTGFFGIVTAFILCIYTFMWSVDALLSR